ncbi:MAG: hypothetical protein SPK17_00025 [Treponema sp.]|nr:hypothetical protein [Treponema sp.]
MRKHYYTSKAIRNDVTNTIKELEFKYTISKARDTYGYNICSLWIHTDEGRKKVAMTCGGGYDMQGVCLANFIAEYKLFKQGLFRLKPRDFNGLTFYDEKARKSRKQYNPGNKIYINGVYGRSSMESILSALGFYLVQIEQTTNMQRYIIKSY